MQVPGPHHVRAEASWNLGQGVLVMEGDAKCADPPPPPPPPTTTTTTTVAAPTTVAPPTTAQVKAAEVGLATDSNAASNPTEVEGTGLPNTGTDSGPLLLLSGGFIAAGALAIRGSRRWRSAR